MSLAVDSPHAAPEAPVRPNPVRLTDRAARESKVGGELLAIVW